MWTLSYKSSHIVVTRSLHMSISPPKGKCDDQSPYNFVVRISSADRNGAENVSDKTIARLSFIMYIKTFESVTKKS